MANALPPAAAVVEDVYLENGVGKTESMLRVETSATRTRVVYLKVTVANAGTLASAKLRLRCDGDDGSGVMRVYQGSHNNWTAGSITAATAPQRLAQITQLNTKYVIGQDYDLDVSAFISKDGTYTLILTKDELGGDMAFSSSRGPVAPKLLIETAGITPPPDTSVPQINQFSVVPEAGVSAAIITYRVSASSGTTLKEVQVWRAPDISGAPGVWKYLLNNSLDLSSLNVSSYTGGTRDGVSPGGWYWYKIIVADKAGKTAEAVPIKINTIDDSGTTSPVCGANGCEAALGETCKTCPQDCGNCPADNPGQAPANPNASPAAKNVLKYLYSLPSRTTNKVVSGQSYHYLMSQDREEYDDYITAIYDQSGEYPGLVGTDLMFGPPEGPYPSNWANARLIDCWRRGNLVTLSWQDRKSVV